MGQRFIDLSVPLHNFASEYNSPEITYWDHEDFCRRTCGMWDLDPSEFPEPYVGSASEKLTLASHAGTHIDAPWHFGPRTAGTPSKTVDEVPLEWCFGDGVMLDFTGTKDDGETIRVEDLEEALDRISYQLKPLDIVVLRTGAGEYWDKPDYNERGSGLDGASVKWLVGQGVRMITTDAFSLDIPIPRMVEKFRQGDKDSFFPAHRAGREVEYAHAEKVVNVHLLPSSGFKIALFPVKIRRGSGAWCRAVGIVDDDA
jgi:kynurenine formamidase